MTRFLSFLGAVLLIASSFGLYKLKYEVQRLDRQATGLKTSIRAERQLIQVLGAEWTYLNQPQRIQDLSDRFLALKPLEPSQIGSIDDIPFRGAHPDPAPRIAAGPVGRLHGGRVATTLAAVQTQPAMEDDQ